MRLKPKPVQIDREKLRAAVRTLKREYAFHMLIDAIELLPQAKLHTLAKKYLDLDRLLPDPDQTGTPSLLADVKRFQQASLAGEYYESFSVNSRNCTEQSAGTSAWMAEFLLLLDRWRMDARTLAPGEAREAGEILFGLLDRIDECCDDIIFFADEGGSWQVGVDWAGVLPVWFKVLSATAEPAEYARRVTSMLARHYKHGGDKMLSIARRSATADQRKALAAVGSPGIKS